MANKTLTKDQRAELGWMLTRISHLYGLSYEAEKAARTAAHVSPMRAYSCYRAILNTLCGKCLGYGIYEDVEASIHGHAEYFCDCKTGARKYREFQKQKT